LWQAGSQARQLRNRSLRPRNDSVSFRIVDIAAPEFSLALRHSSGRCRCKLWPQNENLIFGNDFNDRGKPPLGRERARYVTFITSGMATLTEKAR
jgi:hypothetical protein